MHLGETVRVAIYIESKNKSSTWFRHAVDLNFALNE